MPTGLTEGRGGRVDMAVAETDRSCEQLSDLRGEGAVVRWITQRDGY